MHGLGMDTILSGKCRRRYNTNMGWSRFLGKSEDNAAFVGRKAGCISRDPNSYP